VDSSLDHTLVQDHLLDIVPPMDLPMTVPLVPESQKARELALLGQWRKTEQPKYFQELYTSMKPLLYDAARKASYGSNVPESAHHIYAAQNFLDALRTFKPGKASLQTHVYGAVHQKAKRLNYMYQNVGQMPEPRAMQVGLFQNEHSNLKGELGRDPTHSEIAGRLGWTVRDVMHIQKEIHKDLAIGEGTDEVAFSEGSIDTETLNHLYFDLTPEEKNVYDLVYGKHGRPKMSKANGRIDFVRIAQTSGYSASKARIIWGRIKTKFEKAVRR